MPDRALLRGRRILLVEDSVDTREALQRLFQRRECQVSTAASGEEALDLALRETPEIIISDLGLPGMSGLEFMTQLARPARVQGGHRHRAQRAWPGAGHSRRG